MKGRISIATGSAVIGVVLAGSWALVFAPYGAKREALVGQIAEERHALDELRALPVGAGEVQGKVENLAQSIGSFEKQLPRERDLDRVLKSIGQMAQDQKLEVVTIRAGKDEVGAHFNERPIEMVLNGDFKTSFYEFLLQLERMPGGMRVRQMNLTKVADKDGEIVARMTLGVFYEPDSAPGAVASGE